MIGGIVGTVVGVGCVLVSLVATVRYSIWARLLLLLLGVWLILTTWVHTYFYVGAFAVAIDAIYLHPQIPNRWTNEMKEVVKRVLNGRVVHPKKYNIDKTSPVIFVLNHLTNARPVDEFTLSLLDQPNIRIVTVEKSPTSFVGQILKGERAIQVKHGGGFEDFIRQGVQAIKDGDSLVIFPEGKYSEHQGTWKHLNPFQRGAFALSKATGVPIVPVVIDGRCCPNGFISADRYTTPLTYTFLPAIEPSSFTIIDEMRDAARDSMQKHINSLQ